MKNVQLDHINLTTSNLDESLAWYSRVFGFEKVEEGIRMGRRWAIVRSGDSMLCISEWPNKKNARADSSWEGSHHINHFALRISDRTKWEEVLEKEKLETSYESPVSYPHSTSWYVTDPAGHEIEVALWNEGKVQFPQ